MPANGRWDLIRRLKVNSNITVLFYIQCISAAYFIIPACFVLRQGYIPEEHCANRAQTSNLKECIS